MIIVMIVLHAVFISLNKDLLQDTTHNWLLYFLVIEIPCACYLGINLLFILTCKMEMYQKRLLKFRYILIDLIAIGIAAGFVTMIVEYSIAKTKLDYASYLSFAE